MTHVPLIPRPVQRSTRKPDPYLIGLLQELTELQLHGRVLTTDATGEDDVRLQAWWASGHRTVELLWSNPGEARPARLVAIRVIGDGREVWRSPSGPGCPGAAVRLVRDLLLLEEAALLRRYQRLS